MLCWVAANWSSWHRFAKFGVIVVVLIGGALIAAAIPRGRVAGLLVAFAATGGLLALLGQTYPSGADAWQLFAYWVLLGLPFALAGRHDAIWSLFALVACAAIVLWQRQTEGDPDLSNVAPGWAMAFGLAVVLWPHAPRPAWMGRSLWAFRIACIGATILVSADAFETRTTFEDRDFAALVILGAGGAAIAWCRPLELGVLAVVTLAFDILLIGRMAPTMLKHELADIFLFALGVIVIVSVSLALLRLVRREAASAEPAEAADSRIDWPLAVFGGIGALIAAIPSLVFVLLSFESVLQSRGSLALLGIPFMAVGAVMMRGGALLGFRQVFGLTSFFVGVLHIVPAMLESVQLGAAAVALSVVVAAIVVPLYWARTVFGFAACLAVVTAALNGVSAQWTWPLASLAAAAGAIVLAWPSISPAQREGAVFGAIRSFALGWSAAALCVLMAFAGQPYLVAYDIAADFGELMKVPPAGWNVVVSTVSGITGCALLLWRRAELRTPAGLVLAVVAVALTIRAPSLGGALLVFGCAVLAGSRSLTILAALAILWIVSAFYYSLAWGLTEKAYALVGLGLMLGLVAFAGRWDDVATGTADDRAAGPALALIGLGLGLLLSAVAPTIWSAERILSHGRLIYVALAPVDPRSMIQGDYMAVAFDVHRLPPAWELHGEFDVVATLDSRSVATIQSIAQPAAKVGNDEILLRVRTKTNRSATRWFIGSDAWFFEEGQSERFAKARFGAFRIGSNGRPLLVGLTDENLHLLPAS